jgi:hypothetical protein
MTIGIVGLPNAGKSTLLNALARAHTAAVAPYPFCTIEPNRAVVAIPDERLDEIARVSRPAKLTPATVAFVDIAGLVRGASKGEGLGNRFLSHVRDADALLHVVRCFEDENVAHVDGGVAPARDAGCVETELLLADLETLETRVDKLARQARAEPDLRPLLRELERVRDHVAAGHPASEFRERLDDEAEAALREARLLTRKPALFCANVDEAGLSRADPRVAALAKHAGARGAPVIRVCGKMEEELADLPPEERRAFQSSFGEEADGLEQVIRAARDALGLITFFTTLSNETRAWTVRRGCGAAQAAGTIHTDFERGFIRAHVANWRHYVAHHGEAGCRTAGVLKEEGRDYEVRDGDVIHFLFNV